MGLLYGVDITLYDKVPAGQDAFNRTIYEETPVTVSNVLITPSSSNDVIDDLQLYGKTAEYELSIPKGDTHVWEDRKIEFFGQTWHSFGISREYIESLVPLSWNKKVKVERYG